MQAWYLLISSSRVSIGSLVAASVLEDLDCWFRYFITFFWNTLESFLDLMRLGGSYTYMYINMHNTQRWVHFKYRSRNLPYLQVPPTQKWKLEIRRTPLKYWYARSTVRLFTKDKVKTYHFFCVRICRSLVSFSSASKAMVCKKGTTFWPTGTNKGRMANMKQRQIGFTATF